MTLFFVAVILIALNSEKAIELDVPFIAGLPTK